MNPLGSGHSASNPRDLSWLPRAWLLALVAALPVPLAVAAQAVDVAVGSTVRVTGTEGQGLNVRDAPARTATVVARLEEGATLEVIGPEQRTDGLRWLNVREPGGKSGWAAGDFLTVVSTPAPAPATKPAATTAPPSAPAPSPTAARAPDPAATPVPAPLEVDPRVKFPETAHREQTLTVTVTRDGVPVPGAQVTAITQDSDRELIREFDPTDEEGRTVRSFSIRREKGTIVLLVTALAPDGGKGEKEVSYFRR